MRNRRELVFCRLCVWKERYRVSGKKRKKIIHVKQKKKKQETMNFVRVRGSSSSQSHSSFVQDGINLQKCP